MDTRSNARQAEIERIRGPALDRMHTASCRFVPTVNHLLDALPKAGIAAEIGVASGDFSKAILNRFQPSKLHPIDARHDVRSADGLDPSESLCGANRCERRSSPSWSLSRP